jgi:hypothetical protein
MAVGVGVRISDLDPTEFYKTTDMALVTYLRMEGHTVQTTGWIGNTCHWAFAKTTELLGLVDQFARDEALVNPKSYNKEFSQTKSELYQTDPHSSRPH